jgi:hypothetical protein
MAKARVENPPKFNFPDDFRDISPFLGQCDATDSKGRYLHWSQFKWRVEKENAENLWKAVRFKRMTQYKHIG